MPAITLTSDWGKSGCYLPQLKGSLLSLPAEGFSLETISDSIEPFDVEEACFILKHSFPFFPKGSIHILAVSGKLQQRAAVSIVCSMGFFFIGEDDGRFSLLFENYDSLNRRGKFHDFFSWSAAFLIEFILTDWL